MLKAEELNLEHVQLKNDHWILEQQLRHRDEELQKLHAMPNLVEVRSSVLKSLTSGKGKVASTSPQYRSAARALDRFIGELQKSTPASTPASLTAQDGIAAPVVSEATKKLESKHYTKAEYYDELRQITERCGYRLFIDTTTLGSNRELFIVSPPGNNSQAVVSTQDVGEVLDWLRKQDLK